ncbi:MAG TPA: winged helix-turn-helix domain-containing protein, partial [Vicinamibacterales bacterium]|nr:winged helix-turn-helix domain-containing protein [Vicinamibacterales bacterium]
MASGISYAFGGFRLDAAERRLMRGGAAVHLTPKAHDLLVTLVRHAGRLVTKEALLAEVWPDAFVEEGILAVHISALRKALGDASRPPAYIETVARSGYRFIAPVTTAAQRGELSSEASRPLEAYELVGKGRAHLLTASYFELPKAVESFQAAIDLDPSYPAAHAGLALARCAQARLRAVPHEQAYADAKASALRALALDSTSADAQVALGAVLFVSEWDWTGAEHSLRRALEISPHHLEALLHFGSLMEAIGQLDRGLLFKQQALATHPSSPLVHVQLATAYWHQRRYDDAVVWARRALALDPKHLLAREFLTGAYWMTGDFDAFLAENITQAEAYGAPAETIAHVRSMCEQMTVAH